MRPLALGWLFEVLEEGVRDIHSRLIFAILRYLSFAIGFVVLHAPSRLIERRLAFMIRRNFYEVSYTQLVEHPLEWHRRHHSGDTMSRLRKAGDALYLFAGGQFRWIQVCCGLLGPIILIGYLSWPIAVFICVANTIILALVARFDHTIVQAIKSENAADHRFASTLMDYIANMTTILSLRLGSRTRGEVVHAHDAAERPLYRHIDANEAKYGFISVSVAILEAACLLCFITLDLSTLGKVRIGMSVAVFRYITVLGRAFFEAAYVYQDLLHRRANFETSQTLMHPKRTAHTIDNDEPPIPWNFVSIQNLRFTHPETDQACLRDINLHFRVGERIALIGPSGSGKTTLLAVLRGLLEPESMTLDMDGSRLQDLRPFRAGVVLVPQEAELFENTLRFNITGGLPCRTDDIMAAVHDSELQGVLASLPLGLETNIRERGINLSGGERQRLALARALLLGKDARLVLLDEATSSVDQETEARIYERIFHRFQDRTIFASIHGLHLLPLFDRVLQITNGRLDELAPPLYDEQKSHPRFGKDH